MLLCWAEKGAICWSVSQSVRHSLYRSSGGGPNRCGADGWRRGTDKDNVFIILIISKDVQRTGWDGAAAT